ncbi:MAG: hypothetical protein ACU841_06020 [Gammaproteobacteria bacterium]
MRNTMSVCLLSIAALATAQNANAETNAETPPPSPPALKATLEPLTSNEATLYYFHGAPALATNAFTTFVSCTNFGGPKVPDDITVRFEVYTPQAALLGACSATLAADANGPTSTLFSIQNLAGMFATGCSLGLTNGNPHNVIRVITPKKVAQHIVCEAKGYDTTVSPFNRIVNIDALRVGKKFKNPK